MEVNFLSSDRQKREAEARERLKRALPTELHEAEAWPARPPLKPVAPASTPPPPATTEPAEKPIEPTELRPSVPVAATTATVTGADYLSIKKDSGFTPVPLQAPQRRASVGGASRSAAVIRTPQPEKRMRLIRPAGRLVEYIALCSVVVIVFVSGVAMGVAMRPMPAPVISPVATGVSIADHEAALAKDRDVLRLVQVALIQESLDEYWRQNEARFPGGTDLILGSDMTRCLGASGWISRDSCVLPVNPSENRVYLSTVPRDPGAGSYQYTVLDAGRAYRLRFTLEVGADGIPAGEQQRTGGAVPAAPVPVPTL